MIRNRRTAAIVTASIWASIILSSTAALKAAEGQRWALLVGVNDYVEFKNLQYCQRDAEALRDTLVSTGFPKKNVFLLASGASEASRQPFKANIERQLKIVLGLAEAGDMVLVCFCGHGIHVDGRTFLCPSEANENDPSSTMIALNWVYQQLSDSPASQKMFWVDACRNDPRRSGSRAAHSKDLESIGRELAKPPEGVLVLASCKEGQISWEDDEFRHGIFIHYLLEGLSGKADRESGDRNHQVSLLELYKYANINTKRTVANRQNKLQTPELFGRITGDFDIAELRKGLPKEIMMVVSVAELRRDLPEDYTNSIGMKLKLIPAGEFMMGSPEDEEYRGNDEQQHRVRITKPFHLGTTEVTQGQWQQVMGSQPWSGGEGVKEGSDFAATYVSWDDAMEFCSKLSEKEGQTYRLPTEAQWEYTCRAGSRTAYNFGDSHDDLSDCAWWGGILGDGNCQDEQYAHLVGQKRGNAWGLYDTHGNVWEWCHDWYGEGYHEGLSKDDPTGPTTGSYRVYRGGAWYGNAWICRTANRDWNAPDIRDSRLGFRVALIPAELRVREKLELVQVERALQLYRALNGELPKSLDEFMEQIVKANQISLPNLQEGNKYVYDPEKGELLVEKQEPQ